MRATVTKTFRFEASHQLPNHDGKCKNLHGHSYKVVVACSGKISETSGHAKEGMVVDFADIKHVWKEKLEPVLDHQHLNDSLPSDGRPTTAENIAVWILKAFTANGIPVSAVTLWETESSSAFVKLGDVLNGH